jgi:beta-lactam-binding protein with PASTA domain
VREYLLRFFSRPLLAWQLAARRSTPNKALLRKAFSTIPDVAGLTPEQAEQALRGAGFDNFHSSQVVSSSQLLGKVVATKPPANSTPSPKDEILIIVGSGPLQHLIPDCVGLAADQCEQRLVQAGFINHLLVGDNGNPLQRVVVTDPPAGQVAPIDTSVSIHLGP